MPPPVGFVPDPVAFAAKYWPRVRFYDKQLDALYSLRDNYFTVMPAAQKMGKDFLAGFYLVYFFATRHPVRVVVTSAKDDHLRVVWGEAHNFVQTAAVPLTADRGGPFTTVNLRELKKLNPHTGEECRLSYAMGMVAGPDSIAAMGGHHVPDPGDGIPRTLFMTDESSSVQQAYWDTARPWSHRIFSIGNTWPCDNELKWALLGRPGTDDRGGDQPDPADPSGKRLYRKVVHARAADSPNVRRGLAQVAAGETPDDAVLVPGLKRYSEYVRDLARLDPQLRAVVLEAEFYEGAEVKLFPRALLEAAERYAAELDALTAAGSLARTVVAAGCDPAEGGDKTAFAGVDEYGLVALETHSTPDTSRVVDLAVDFLARHRLDPRRMFFDRGGGGKQHADRLRAMGYAVGTVGFGESPAEEPKAATFTPVGRKVDVREDKFAFVNRRAEMYADLARLCDPSVPREVWRVVDTGADPGKTADGYGGGRVRYADARGFGLPRRFGAVSEQLAPLPRLYDGEGRMYLPPKNRKAGSNPNVRTVTELVGHSPDEADAVVLAVAAYLAALRRPRAGV